MDTGLIINPIDRSEWRQDYLGSLLIARIITIILQHYRDTTISGVCEDNRRARFCVNMDYSEFKRDYARFKAAGNEAKRLSEMKSEASCKAAISAYESAISIGERLLDKIDWVKIEESNQEHKKNAILSSVMEENSSNKDKIIGLLNRQISMHPKRSFAAVVIIFIASGFINSFLKDVYDQVLGPYVRQYITENSEKPI